MHISKLQLIEVLLASNFPNYMLIYYKITLLSQLYALRTLKITCMSKTEG